MFHDSWKFGNPWVAGGYPKPTVWWTESFLARIPGLFLPLCPLMVLRLVLPRSHQVSNILHVDPSVPRFVPSSIVIPTGVQTSESHGQQTTDFRGSNLFILTIQFRYVCWNFCCIIPSRNILQRSMYDGVAVVTLIVNDARFKASSRRVCVAARHIWRWRHSLFKAVGFVICIVYFNCILERIIDVRCLSGALRCFWGWSLHFHSHLTCRQDCFVDPWFTLLQKEHSERIHRTVMYSCCEWSSYRAPAAPKVSSRSEHERCMGGWLMTVLYWFKFWFLWSFWHIYSVHGCKFQLHLRNNLMTSSFCKVCSMYEECIHWFWIHGLVTTSVDLTNSR